MSPAERGSTSETSRAKEDKNVSEHDQAHKGSAPTARRMVSRKGQGGREKPGTLLITLKHTL
jgi:hypothetical protein